MSKHTDKTAEMTERFKRQVEAAKKQYNIKFKTSPPKNKNVSELNDIKYRFTCVKNLAAKYGIVAEFNIIAVPTPEDQHGYNCIGCRKRKKGDYMWFGYDEYKSYGGWFRDIGKVCSTECAELMTLRLL
jgi:Tfp pilus assembly protein PilE